MAHGIDACPSLTCDQEFFFFLKGRMQGRRVWSQVSPSHITLTIALARLFVLRSAPQFLKKREAASSLDIRYIPSQSSADQQSFRKSSCKKKVF